MFIQIKLTFTKWKKESYEHAWIWKSLITNNFCYERARDLISFSVDQKLKTIIINVKHNENWSTITTARVPKMIKLKIVTYIHENANLRRPLIFGTSELET